MENEGQLVVQQIRQQLGDALEAAARAAVASTDPAAALGEIRRCLILTLARLGALDETEREVRRETLWHSHAMGPAASDRVH